MGTYFLDRRYTFISDDEQMPGPSGVQRVLDSRVNWSEFHDRLTEYESQLENGNDFVQNKKKQWDVQVSCSYLCA